MNIKRIGKKGEGLKNKKDTARKYNIHVIEVLGEERNRGRKKFKEIM